MLFVDILCQKNGENCMWAL